MTADPSIAECSYTSTISTCTVGFLPHSASTVLRTARSTAPQTKSGSRRLARGRLSNDSKIAASIAASSPAPSRRALRQAGDQHVGVARHLALGGQGERDRHHAGEGELAPLGDAIVARRQQDRAVLHQPAVVDAGDDARFARREPHHVAVVGPHHLADPLGARESRVLGEMQRLAMRRHGDLRLQPVVKPERPRRGADGRRHGRDGCGR